MSIRRHRQGGIRALLPVSLLLAVVWGPTAITAASPVPVSDAGAAISSAVAGQGSYAGDCAGTQSPSDLGRLCSKLVAQKGAIRVYLVGRTFSEFSEWVFVEQTGAGWTVVAMRPYDDSTLGGVPWPGS